MRVGLRYQRTINQSMGQRVARWLNPDASPQGKFNYLWVREHAIYFGDLSAEELAQRLENQTSEVLRLTLELEEYEYKDFGTANDSNQNKDDDEEDEEEVDSDYEYVDDGDGKEPW